MAQVQITIQVDDELADDNDETGLTEVGYYTLVNAVMAVGQIIEGPANVGS